MTQKTVVVTGGSAGVGAQIVADFLEEGASVAVLDVKPSDNADALFAHCDVSDSASVEAAVHQVVDALGDIDVLVNNAGAVSRFRAQDLPESEWDRIFDINIKGTYLVTRAALPSLLRTHGSIVNVASQAGVRAETLLSHYCAAKAAVVHYTRALALELAPDVRVNVVCPGFVETEMAHASLVGVAAQTGQSYEEVRDARRSVIPLDRFQSPKDISNGVRFLVGAGASEITGQVLNVSGGQTL